MKIDDAINKNIQPETSEIKGDTWTVSLPKTRIHTLEELLEYCQVDLSIWEVERFTCNRWEGFSKGKDDSIVVTPLYQVKAFLKKRKDVEAVKQEIESLKELAKEFPWKLWSATSLSKSKIKQPETKSGLLLEVNFPDLHYGKLAWGRETGESNYDVKLADEVFWKALEAILDRVRGYKFEQVLFVIGNDALNSDDIEGRTTAGTYVSTDGRYHKTFATVRTAMIKAIKRLQQIAPVKVLPVYGNHDRLSSWHLADSIEMFFHGDDTVEVDNLPRTRKYHSWGKVLLGFTHGDKGKRSDYPLLMATEVPELFGKSLYREIHTGHTHMTKLDEQHGVRVRVLPALCPADDWHSQSGFVGNQRSAEGYVWDKEEGLLSIVFYTEKK